MSSTPITTHEKQRIKYLIPSPPNIDLLNRNIEQNNLTTYNYEFFIKIFSNWLKSMNYDDEIITFRMCSRYDSLSTNNTPSKYHDNIMIFETLGTPRFQNNAQYIEKPFNPDLPDSTTRIIAVETAMLQDYFYNSTLSTQDKQIKSIYNNYHEIINKYIHKESPLCIEHQDFGILKLTVYCEPFHIYLNEANRRIIGTYGIDTGLHLFLDTGLKIYNPEFDIEWVTQNSTLILIDSFQKHNYLLVTINDINIDINRSFFRKHYFGSTYNYNTVITDKDMQEQYITDHYLLIDHIGKSIKYYSKRIKHLHYQDGKITKKEIIKDITHEYELWKEQQQKPKVITCVDPYKSDKSKNKIKFFNKKQNKSNEPIIKQPKQPNIIDLSETEEWTILSNHPEPITSLVTCDFTTEDYEIR